MANIGTSAKAQWIGLSLGIVAILLVIAATIITGAQKGRTRLGIGLSLLSVFFGLGFLIMMLVPAKNSQPAA